MSLRHIPRCLLGMFVGQAFWLVAALATLYGDRVERYLPHWFQKIDLIDTLGTMAGVVAAPITLGGWLLIWGDSGPPYEWIESRAFIVAFGLSLYGLIGAAIGQVTARWS